MQIRKKFTIKKLILLLIISTIIVTALTLARYESSYADKDSAVVAGFVFLLDTNEPSELLITPKNPIENVQICEFSVKNKEDDGAASEVSVQYTIKIESLENLPLEFELYRKGSDVNLFEGSGKVTSEPIKMEYTEDVAHEYELKIKWQEGKNSYLYNKTLDYVKIILDAEQFD